MSSRSRPPVAAVAMMDQRAAQLRSIVADAVGDLREHNEVCSNPWCGLAGIICELDDDDEIDKKMVAEVAAMAIHMLAERADADVAEATP